MRRLIAALKGCATTILQRRRAGLSRPADDRATALKGCATIVCLIVVIAASVTLSAVDWPQLRGPTLNGVSAERNLPIKWSATENIAWKLPLPAWSGSTPIVWGDRVFLSVAEDLRHRDGDNLFLWCVDRANGSVL